MPNDNVNHPSHYNKHPSGIECIDIVRHMTFNIGSAIKYLWRADHKGATIEDLEKAIFYIKDEISRLGGVKIEESKIPCYLTKHNNNWVIRSVSDDHIHFSLPGDWEDDLLLEEVNKCCERENLQCDVTAVSPFGKKPLKKARIRGNISQWIMINTDTGENLLILRQSIGWDEAQKRFLDCANKAGYDLDLTKVYFDEVKKHADLVHDKYNWIAIDSLSGEKLYAVPKDYGTDRAIKMFSYKLNDLCYKCDLSSLTLPENSRKAFLTSNDNFWYIIDERTGSTLMSMEKTSGWQYALSQFNAFLSNVGYECDLSSLSPFQNTDVPKSSEMINIPAGSDIVKRDDGKGSK